MFNRDFTDEGKIMKPTDEKVAVAVDLDKGLNSFKVVLEDAAGNKVEKEVKVERSASELRADRISGKDRYETAVKVSHKDGNQLKQLF